MALNIAVARLRRLLMQST